MNEAVQDFVAEPVELQGKLGQYDDWIVMYVNADKVLNIILTYRSILLMM